MKKSGRFEKKPVNTAEKQPKAKSALLQTYLTSLLCMVLCVGMFLGTSFAWFTSEVSNAGNEIYIGTLDVGLFKQVPDGTDDGTEPDFVPLDGADAPKLFNQAIRWEPGYTALETIQVVNEGDLAFKYMLTFTDGTATDTVTNATMELEKVAQHFEVWVYDHRDNGNKTPNPTSYADMTAENSGWYCAGTLADILAGKTVFTGNMESVNKDHNPAQTTESNGVGDGLKTIDTYTVALHMKEDTNDPNLMGQKISLTVKLLAYQKSQELDGFGEGNKYDDLELIINADQLKAALGNGSIVLLDRDIELDTDERVIMNGGMLSGDGKTITYKGDAGENGASLGVVTTTGGTIRDLHIDGGAHGRALYITELKSDLFVSNSTFSGAYAFNLNSAIKTDYTLNFTNTKFGSWTSFANVIKHAFFTGCSFGTTLKPYADTTLDNCIFTLDGGLVVSALEAGETITLVNCTYDGVFIDKVVITSDENGVTISANQLLEISEDGKLVLKTASNP